MSVIGAISRQQKRVVAFTAVTDASGNAVFNIASAGFAAAPICTTACESANGNLIDSRITARTAASVTVNVQQSIGVTILGIGVLAAKTPANGVTVHLHAEEP